ncbi:MAG: oxidoreductase [Bacteroidota bacterium]|nr:oxidoreductase [Bacteroidota bacterium]MDP4213616.1 oxidoreductase [Bacteroidota bacterium]MDP4248480.1 oxidoreductase [Bacteroidota bacterium]
MKTGVIGYGVAAQAMHLPFITTNPKFQLLSILQRHGQSAKEKYPGVNLVRSLEEMLADPMLELVVVTTPNDTHFEYASRSLNAGKHVVLEKPFTITSEEAKKLVAIAGASGKTLSVFQNRRYVSDFLTIRQLLKEKKLGEIVEFEAHYDRYRPEQKPNAWREEDAPGTGILYDLGAHLIDQVLCLFGLPKSVTADLRMQRPHARTTDYFDLWLDYGFTRITLKSGMLVREPGPRYMIHGTKGSFIKYGEDPQEALLRQGMLPNTPDWGREPEENFGLLHTEINGRVVREKYPSLPGNYGGYYDDLYDAIVNDGPLRVTPEQGYNTVKLIELATESNQKNCTIICRDLMDVPYN